MARRVTPKDIVKFHDLYEQYGTYAAVARATGFSASTVGRHLKLQGAARVTRQTWGQLLDLTHEPAIKAK